MDDSLQEQLIVAAAGPAVTAVLALLVVNQVADRVANRREEQRTRERFVREMAEVATALYLATQQFWRTSRKIPRAQRRRSPDLETPLLDLDLAYRESRTRARVLEAEVRTYYGGSRVQELWHQVDDLLTVRYFQLTAEDDRRLAKIYELNRIGKDSKTHSGLTAVQLGNPELVLSSYHVALEEALEAARTAKLATRPTFWTRFRSRAKPSA